jgi:hypothetical protein
MSQPNINQLLFIYNTEMAQIESSTPPEILPFFSPISLSLSVALFVAGSCAAQLSYIAQLGSSAQGGSTESGQETGGVVQIGGVEIGLTPIAPHLLLGFAAPLGRAAPTVAHLAAAVRFLNGSLNDASNADVARMGEELLPVAASLRAGPGSLGLITLPWAPTLRGQRHFLAAHRLLSRLTAPDARALAGALFYDGQVLVTQLARDTTRFVLARSEQVRLTRSSVASSLRLWDHGSGEGVVDLLTVFLERDEWEELVESQQVVGERLVDAAELVRDEEEEGVQTETPEPEETVSWSAALDASVGNSPRTSTTSSRRVSRRASQSGRLKRAHSRGASLSSSSSSSSSHHPTSAPADDGADADPNLITLGLFILNFPRATLALLLPRHLLLHQEELGRVRAEVEPALYRLEVALAAEVVPDEVALGLADGCGHYPPAAQRIFEESWQVVGRQGRTGSGAGVGLGGVGGVGGSRGTSGPLAGGGRGTRADSFGAGMASPLLSALSSSTSQLSDSSGYGTPLSSSTSNILSPGGLASSGSLAHSLARADSVRAFGAAGGRSPTGSSTIAGPGRTAALGGGMFAGSPGGAAAGVDLPHVSGAVGGTPNTPVTPTTAQLASSSSSSLRGLSSNWMNEYFVVAEEAASTAHTSVAGSSLPAAFVDLLSDAHEAFEDGETTLRIGRTRSGCVYSSKVQGRETHYYQEYLDAAGRPPSHAEFLTNVEDQMRRALSVTARSDALAKQDALTGISFVHPLL